MSEYIITAEQLKTATEAYLEHELKLPITEVFVSGDKLPEIVRCRDCKYLVAHRTGCSYWDFCDVYDTNGFCAWGERRDA